MKPSKFTQAASDLAVREPRIDLAKDALRYRFVIKLTPQEFSKLKRRALKTNTLDEAVDISMPE